MQTVPTVDPEGRVTLHGRTYQHAALLPHVGLTVRAREAHMRGLRVCWITTLTGYRVICCAPLAPVTGDRSISEAARLAA